MGKDSRPPSRHGVQEPAGQPCWVYRGGMFTGLVQCIGTVASPPEPTASGIRLRVGAGWSHTPREGASIAVDGCCLTVIDEGEHMSFDVVGQTLSATTLGTLRAGSAVNLEHAVTPATLLGGHVVQGHVDAVARVVSVAPSASDYRARIEIPAGGAGLLVSRGSITVSGVSLTIAELGDTWFEVALIPTTLKETTLGCLRGGDSVNLEYDVLAKLVARHLEVAVNVPAT